MSPPTPAPSISKLTFLKERKRGAYQHLILSRHLFLLRREPEGYRTRLSSQKVSAETARPSPVANGATCRPIAERVGTPSVGGCWS